MEEIFGFAASFSFFQLEHFGTFHQDLRVRFSFLFGVHSYWKWKCLGRVPPCIVDIPPETILLRMSYNPSFLRAPSPFAFFPVFGFCPYSSTSSISLTYSHHPHRLQNHHRVCPCPLRLPTKSFQQPAASGPTYPPGSF